MVFSCPASLSFATILKDDKFVQEHARVNEVGKNINENRGYKESRQGYIC